MKLFVCGVYVCVGYEYVCLCAGKKILNLIASQRASFNKTVPTYLSPAHLFMYIQSSLEEESFTKAKLSKTFVIIFSSKPHGNKGKIEKEILLFHNTEKTRKIGKSKEIALLETECLTEYFLTSFAILLKNTYLYFSLFRFFVRFFRNVHAIIV